MTKYIPASSYWNGWGGAQAALPSSTEQKKQWEQRCAKSAQATHRGHIQWASIPPLMHPQAESASSSKCVNQKMARQCKYWSPWPGLYIQLSVTVRHNPKGSCYKLVWRFQSFLWRQKTKPRNEKCLGIHIQHPPSMSTPLSSCVWSQGSSLQARLCSNCQQSSLEGWLSLSWNCASVWGYMLMHAGAREVRASDPLELVIGSCKPPDLGAGNWIQILFKSSKHSLLILEQSF